MKTRYQHKTTLTQRRENFAEGCKSGHINAPLRRKAISKHRAEVRFIREQRRKRVL